MKKSKADLLKRAVELAHSIGPVWHGDSIRMGSDPLPRSTRHIPKPDYPVCPGCGESFYTKNKKRIYCSTPCSQRHKRKLAFDAKPPIMRECIVCEKPFQAHRQDASICSPECRLLYDKRNYKYWNKVKQNRLATRNKYPPWEKS